MTLQQSTIRRLLRPTLAASIAVVMIAGTVATALAGDDDDDDNELPDTKIFRSILNGIGLKKDGTGDGIDYRERSPLVVPPTRELPPPEAPGAGLAANPAFPVDQDEKRRKQSKKAAARSVNFDWYDLSKPLSPSDMKKGTATVDGVRKGQGRTIEDANAQMKPSELGYKGGLFDFTGFFSGNNVGETGKFVSEPPRASLVEPPSGYRTPSPSQPYGLGKDTTPSRAQDIYDLPVAGSGATVR